MPSFPYSKILIAIGIIIVLIAVEGLAYICAILRIMATDNARWLALSERVKMAKNSYILHAYLASYKINIFTVVVIVTIILLIP